MLLFDLPKLLCPNTIGVNWSVLSADTAVSHHTQSSSRNLAMFAGPIGLFRLL